MQRHRFLASATGEFKRNKRLPDTNPHLLKHILCILPQRNRNVHVCRKLPPMLSEQTPEFTGIGVSFWICRCFHVSTTAMADTITYHPLPAQQIQTQGCMNAMPSPSSPIVLRQISSNRYKHARFFRPPLIRHDDHDSVMLCLRPISLLNKRSFFGGEQDGNSTCSLHGGTYAFRLVQSFRGDAGKRYSNGRSRCCRSIAAVPNATVVGPISGKPPMESSISCARVVNGR